MSEKSKGPGLWMLRRLDRMVLPGPSRVLPVMAGANPTRWRRRLFAMSALTCCVIVVAAVALGSHRDSRRLDTTAVDRTVQIGIRPGESVSTYVTTSQAELEALAHSDSKVLAETYALVSLQTYLAPRRLTPLLDGVTVVEVHLRVQLSQVRTEIVRIPVSRLPEDLLAGMRQIAAENTAAANEYRALAATLSGVDLAEALLRETYLEAAQAAAAEATAYLSACSCVYAVVVRATSDVLDRIAAQPQVRAVDPAPEVLRLEEAGFLAPLPEQQDIEASPSAKG